VSVPFEEELKLCEDVLRVLHCGCLGGKLHLHQIFVVLHFLLEVLQYVGLLICFDLVLLVVLNLLGFQDLSLNERFQVLVFLVGGEGVSTAQALNSFVDLREGVRLVFAKLNKGFTDREEALHVIFVEFGRHVRILQHLIEHTKFLEAHGSVQENRMV